MAKYSYEFKKKVVEEYIQGKGGTPYLSTKYKLGSNTQLRRWIQAYKEFGDEGLMRSRKKNSYTFEFKLSVVELYLTTENRSHSRLNPYNNTLPLLLLEEIVRQLPVADSFDDIDYICGENQRVKDEINAYFDLDGKNKLL